MNKPNSGLKVPYRNLLEFFSLWLKFLRPYHNLSDRELEVAACLLKHRYELSKVILDEEILNATLFNKDTRAKLLKELNITNQYYQIILGKLKKTHIIENGMLNPKFIPKYTENSPFTLLLVFDKKIEKNEL